MNASTAKSKVAKFTGVPYKKWIAVKSALYECYFVFIGPFKGKDFYIVDDNCIRRFNHGEMEFCHEL